MSFRGPEVHRPRTPPPGDAACAEVISGTHRDVSSPGAVGGVSPALWPPHWAQPLSWGPCGAASLSRGEGRGAGQRKGMCPSEGKDGAKAASHTVPAAVRAGVLQQLASLS